MKSLLILILIGLLINKHLTFLAVVDIAIKNGVELKGSDVIKEKRKIIRREYENFNSRK